MRRSLLFPVKQGSSDHSSLVSCKGPLETLWKCATVGEMTEAYIQERGRSRGTSDAASASQGSEQHEDAVGISGGA